MSKQTVLYPLLLLALLGACGKSESPPPPPQSAAPALTPAPVTTPEPASAPAMSAAPADGGAKVAASTDDGKKIYDASCLACHAAGVAGAPKLGDKANWAPRIAQGNDTLYTHAIKGYQGKAGMMPPKGGNMALKDDEVKAAVDYMVSQGK